MLSRVPCCGVFARSFRVVDAFRRHDSTDRDHQQVELYPFKTHDARVVGHRDHFAR